MSLAPIRRLNFSLRRVGTATIPCAGSLALKCKDYASKSANTRFVRWVGRTFPGARFLHVLTNELDHVHQRGLLAQIPILPPMPFVSYAPGSIDRRRFDNPITLTRLSIRLCDYDAAKQTLTPYNFHGLYWSMTLEIATMDRAVPANMTSMTEEDFHTIEPIYAADDVRAEPSSTM